MDEIYISNDGLETILHDPTPSSISILKAGNSNYAVESISPGKGMIPKFRKLLNKNVLLSRQSVLDLELNEALTILSRHSTGGGSPNDRLVSAMDILTAATLNANADCRLCGWNCGVNRFNGKGKCGLNGGQCLISRPFLHIAEEIIINPAVVANFGGCAMRCVYCIAYEQVHLQEGLHTLDPQKFWYDVNELSSRYQSSIPFNSIEFTNPTENLAPVTRLLSHVPTDFNLPVVFNCHLYGSRLFYDIAKHMVDVWLLDLRHCDTCAKNLSGVDEYMKYAEIGMNSILKDNDARVIVRLLVIPGHIDCCMNSSVDFLSRYKDQNHLYISVLDQYVPVRQSDAYPELNRRPTKAEIEQARRMVRKSGLKDIEDEGHNFWQ